jgi:uncharacterized protein
MNSSTLAVSAEQLTELHSILASYASGRGAWAYGSRVRSHPQTRSLKLYSDLDIALDGAAFSLEQMGKLRDALRDSNLPFRVEVTLRTALPNSWALNLYALN